MRIRLTGTAAILILLSGAALAQGNGMGIFFSDTAFNDASTNAAAGAEPLDLYVVVLDCAYASVGGYECRITFAGVQPTVLGADGPAGSGWTNFGDELNHLVQLAQPVVAVGGAAVLGRITIEATAPSLVEIVLGPSAPTSIEGVPVVVDGDDPDELSACGLASGAEIPGIVATINGGGVTPVETRAWSAIRQLFR